MDSATMDIHNQEATGPDLAKMSLEEIIQLNKPKSPTQRRGGKRRRPKQQVLEGIQTADGQVKKKRRHRKKKPKTGNESNQQHQAQIHINPQAPGILTGVGRLVIKNLEMGVTDEDIYELFKTFGKVLEATVHYDRFGRSLGAAHVTYKRYFDALKGQQQYHGVTLDGRPMIIEIESVPNIPRVGKLPNQGQPPNTMLSTLPPSKKKKLAKPNIMTPFQNALGSLQDATYNSTPRLSITPMVGASGISAPFSFGIGPGYLQNTIIGDHLMRFGPLAVKTEQQQMFAANTPFTKGNQQQPGKKNKAKKKKVAQNPQHTPKINQLKGTKKKGKIIESEVPTAEELDRELEQYRNAMKKDPN